ncbi:Coenzyme F420 hydrogenase/dehydrogenase, beta subunit C-terminal domain [uncultured Caulobacter sp.]|uniref:Coenzyme F420 hydrogenase/dehydrogenase, beta subunit C-terminal domain n=1 Tax=uncultured Caulobacter sp. TaxID=158749 RepID=UPI0026365B84|nr:Coenzyme F420 hydrogenase/dehydrogenase, beta subunit C-terminal domain [uncultured Caulobacter sp.]
MDQPHQALSPDEVVRAGLCVGCGGCAGLRAEALEMKLDAFGQLKPRGPAAEVASLAFARTCPFSPGAADEDAIATARFPAATGRDERLGRHEATYIGYVAEGDYRARASSGGLATWTAATLMERGLIDAVAHVAPDPGERLFSYVVSRNVDALRAGAKSRYYPVELSGVVRAILAAPGRYAVIGVPCFIKAIHLLRAQDPRLAERITHTIALFCGHMKSARMAESFAWQMDARLEDAEGFDFRLKIPDQPANWYVAAIDLPGGDQRRKHWWDMDDGDWGAGFFQNSACDWCDDVAGETADLTVGDAWIEPYSADGRGHNVAIVRDPALHVLFEEAAADGRLALTPATADTVAETQAAAFRQRREGLAYRLAVTPPALPLAKRVAPRTDLPPRRKLIYSARRHIARTSHRLFWLARRLRRPALYRAWARSVLSVYVALAYGRGRLGKILDRWR